jgi:hypothetical protein
MAFATGLMADALIDRIASSRVTWYATTTPLRT